MNYLTIGLSAALVWITVAYLLLLKTVNKNFSDLSVAMNPETLTKKKKRGRPPKSKNIVYVKVPKTKLNAYKDKIIGEYGTISAFAREVEIPRSRLGHYLQGRYKMPSNLRDRMRDL